MTPREPDRLEAKAREIVAAWNRRGGIGLGADIAAALRQAADEARQASIDACDDAIGALQGDREVEAALECVKRIRALASPAAAPAAVCDSTMDADELFYHCTLPPGHVGPHKDRGIAEWTDETHHDAPPSEPVAPAADNCNGLLACVLPYGHDGDCKPESTLAPAQGVEARESWQHWYRERQKELARAETAEARIAELERALELAYPYVAEGDEGTEVDGLFHDQIVARINKVMRARAAATKGEGT